MNRDPTKQNSVNETSVNRYFGESAVAVNCHSVKCLSVKRRPVNGRSVNAFPVNGRRSFGDSPTSRQDASTARDS